MFVTCSTLLFGIIEGDLGLSCIFPGIGGGGILLSMATIESITGAKASGTMDDEVLLYVRGLRITIFMLKVGWTCAMVP
jgi:hypothetical protein